MFRSSRKLLEALYGINTTLEALAVAVHEARGVQPLEGPLIDRLEALELSRAVWEAEMDGIFLKSQNQYKAAAASEARARTKAKNDEDLFEEGPPERTAPVEAPPQSGVPERDASNGLEEGLHVLRMGMDDDTKEAAQIMKWGR